MKEKDLSIRSKADAFQNMWSGMFSPEGYIKKMTPDQGAEFFEQSLSFIQGVTGYSDPRKNLSAFATINPNLLDSSARKLYDKISSALEVSLAQVVKGDAVANFSNPECLYAYAFFVNTKEKDYLLPNNIQYLDTAVTPQFNKYKLQQAELEEIARQEEERRQGRMHGGQTDDDGFGFGQLGGFLNSSGSYARAQRRESMDRIRKNPNGWMNSILLSLITNGNVKSLEWGDMQTMMLDGEAVESYKGIADAIVKFSRVVSSRDAQNAAGSGLEAVKKITEEITTHDLEQIMFHNFDIEIKSGEKHVKFSINVAEILDLIRDEEFIDKIMSSASSTQQDAKEQILLRAISKKTGLSSEEIRNLDSTNLFSPDAIDDSKVSDFLTFKNVFMLGLVDHAVAISVITGLVMHDASSIDGQAWPYDLRKLLPARYAEMYSIESPELAKIIKVFWSDFWGRNLSKLHPLLNHSGKVNIENASENIVHKRNEWLEYILYSADIDPRYKEALPALMGFTDENYFVDKFGHKHWLRNDKEKYQFIQKHSLKDSRFYSDIRNSIRKFDILKSTFSEFDSCWAEIDFNDLISFALKRRGYSDAQINHFTSNNSNLISGSSGLRTFLQYGGMTALEIDREGVVPNEISKFWYYAIPVIQSFGKIMELFQSFNHVLTISAHNDEAQFYGAYETLKQEVLKALMEVSNAFGHFDNGLKYEFIRLMLYAFWESGRKPNKQRKIHQFVEKKGKNSVSLDPLKIKSNQISQNDMDKWGGLNFRLRNGYINFGSDTVYKVSYGPDRGGDNYTIFESHPATASIVKMIIAIMQDKKLINKKSAKELKKEFVKSGLFDNKFPVNHWRVVSEAMGAITTSIQSGARAVG